ncbi:MAG: flagellar basal body rod protein FlgC [Candidatus Cloacimonetes bacterium]|nr:flagellar basal body rod protein FlgC [Candidatus Cloacimonadota bacterium]
MLKSLFSAIDVSASGLSVQRTRMNLISENIANAETTRTEDGGPYRRKLAIVKSGVPGEKFSEILKETRIQMYQTDDNHVPEKPFSEIERCSLYGVHVAEIGEDPSPFRMIYDPHHPDANEEGYVAMPNINIVQEMTDMISATRSYEANVTAISSSKAMLRASLKI